VGKGADCYLAARLTSENNQQALIIGALMNARGLLELILLNIGLERGVIVALERAKPVWPSSPRGGARPVNRVVRRPLLFWMQQWPPLVKASTNIGE